MANGNMAVKPHPDEDLLCDAGDRIHSAAHAVMQELAVGELDWDMEAINSLIEKAESLLERKNIPYCRPWEDENGNICYSTSERCGHCVKKEKNNNFGG